MHSLPVAAAEVADFPYKQKTLRQQIDAAAFKIYGHWVKKEEEQNRMTLFQNDEKQNHVPDGSSSGGADGAGGCGAPAGVVLPLLKF